MLLKYAAQAANRTYRTGRLTQRNWHYGDELDILVSFNPKGYSLDISLTCWAYCYTRYDEA